MKKDGRFRHGASGRRVREEVSGRREGGRGRGGLNVEKGVDKGQKTKSTKEMEKMDDLDKEWKVSKRGNKWTGRRRK